MTAVIILVQTLFAGLGIVCFAALFNAPREHFLPCGLAGAAAWLGYCLALLVQDSVVVATLAAAMPLTLLARIFAIVYKAPATTFLVAGIFPLVPGAGIYYTALYFIRGQSDLFAAKGTETLKVALALAVGIFLVLGIPLPGRHGGPPRMMPPEPEPEPASDQ